MNCFLRWTRKYSTVSEYLLFASTSIHSTRKGTVQDGTLDNGMMNLRTDENFDDRKKCVLGSKKLVKLAIEFGLVMEVIMYAQYEDISKICYLPGVKHLKLDECSRVKNGTILVKINSQKSFMFSQINCSAGIKLEEKFADNEDFTAKYQTENNPRYPAGRN